MPEERARKQRKGQSLMKEGIKERDDVDLIGDNKTLAALHHQFIEK